MKKILVIDDEEWLREMVQMALRQRGYEVIEAGDGAAGIDKARKEALATQLHPIHEHGPDREAHQNTEDGAEPGWDGVADRAGQFFRLGGVLSVCAEREPY